MNISNNYTPTSYMHTSIKNNSTSTPEVTSSLSIVNTTSAVPTQTSNVSTRTQTYSVKAPNTNVPTGSITSSNEPTLSEDLLLTVLTTTPEIKNINSYEIYKNVIKKIKELLDAYVISIKDNLVSSVTTENTEVVNRIRNDITNTFSKEILIDLSIIGTTLTSYHGGDKIEKSPAGLSFCFNINYNGKTYIYEYYRNEECTSISYQDESGNIIHETESHKTKPCEK